MSRLAHIEVTGTTRSAFLARATLAAGAVYGASSVTPFVRSALAQGGGGDLEILNYALTLEYLEAAFYAEAIKSGTLKGEVLKIAKEIRDNEDEHVDALTAAIKGAGGKPVKAPGVDFMDSFSDEQKFLETAVTFEDTGVSAYNGAAPNIENKDILAAAGGIVQIEARHAALVRLLREDSPAPNAFDEALEMQAVLDAVQPFLKS